MLSENKKDVKLFAKELDIPYLVHFTHISNLENILKWGLLSRNAVDERYPDTVTNDMDRLDNRRDTISVSIAHPNDKMFYKYRDNCEDWCVLGIKTKALWHLDTLFFKHNAADALVSGKTDEELVNVRAFWSMYDEFNWIPSRLDQCLNAYDPTDVQAEILIKNHMPAEYIFGVVVASRQIKKDISAFTGDIKVVINEPNKVLYAERTYRRKWQQ